MRGEGREDDWDGWDADIDEERGLRKSTTSEGKVKVTRECELSIGKKGLRLYNSDGW